MGRGSGLQRTLKNCKFPLHHLNMCPAELTERREGGGQKEEKKCFTFTDDPNLVWFGV